MENTTYHMKRLVSIMEHKSKKEDGTMCPEQLSSLIGMPHRLHFFFMKTSRKSLYMITGIYTTKRIG